MLTSVTLQTANTKIIAITRSATDRKCLYIKGSRKPLSARTRLWTQAVKTADKLRLGKGPTRSRSAPCVTPPMRFSTTRSRSQVSAPWLRKLKREMLDFAVRCDAKVLYRERPKSQSARILTTNGKTGKARRSAGASDRNGFAPSSITA